MLRLLYLRKVIIHLSEHWHDPSVGLVATGIFNPPYAPIIDTSKQVTEGRWLHAERNALLKYEGRYGFPSPDAIAVVTLSPCIRSVSCSRLGTSCAELLVENGITKVHVGVIDSADEKIGIEEYERLGFHLTITDDEYCRMACQNLYNIFRLYGSRVNYDLKKIKSEINEQVLFESMSL